MHGVLLLFFQCSMETLRTAPAIPNSNSESTATVVQQAFEAQQVHRSTVRAQDAATRIRKIQRLHDHVWARREEIQAAMYQDFRRPPIESAMSDVKMIGEEAQFAMKHLRDWMAPKPVPTHRMLVGTQSHIAPTPKGVVCIMSPWNYPFILTLGPLISALAAGNSVILKPSEYTPHSSALMADMIEQLYDPREVTLVRGDKEAGKALLDQPFDHFFFTGSSAVGRIVMKAAAEHLSSVTLELGGKSPTVVDASADIEHAARTIIWGKFLNAGQTCIAPDYVLAEQSIIDDLLDAMRSALTESYGQTPSARQQSADYARIVNERHFDRLSDALDGAIDAGARLEYGGTVDARERYIEPTVLTEVPNDATLMQEEIFGPILPVQPFDHLDDAIAAINSRENPLALYHFTQDDDATRRLLDYTQSGDVCVNDVIVHFMSPHLPFGGAGHSGIGASGGEYGFKEFSNQRSVMRRTGASGLMQQLYPPYGNVTKKLVDWLLPWA